jgi:hypothetical protein
MRVTVPPQPQSGAKAPPDVRTVNGAFLFLAVLRAGSASLPTESAGQRRRRFGAGRLGPATQTCRVKPRRPAETFGRLTDCRDAYAEQHDHHIQWQSAQRQLEGDMPRLTFHLTSLAWRGMMLIDAGRCSPKAGTRC